MSKLIYVVEDESDILELISLKLKNAGLASGFETAAPMLTRSKSEYRI
jgi:CheY-like chemotaxis protein